MFYSREELVRRRAEWRAAGKTVVLTNGCYDLLHPGHIRLLEQARSLGDMLILALNADSSVRRLSIHSAYRRASSADRRRETVLPACFQVSCQ